LPFGSLFLSLFLLLFLFATLTSSFSLYEVIVAAFTANGKYSRKSVTWILGIVLFIVAIPSALSSSTLAGVEIFNKSIFDATDYLVSNIMLPLGSLLIAIFIIHKVDKVLVKKEFPLGGSRTSGAYSIWRMLMTWIVPITIVIVFLNTLGIV